jgi:hypothetical protein
MGRSLFVTNPVHTASIDSAVTNVTEAAWTEVEDSMPFPANAVEIYNGTGKILRIAKGASGSEAAVTYLLAPKDTSPILPIEFANGERISLRSLAGEGTANLGSVVFNFFG